MKNGVILDDVKLDVEFDIFVEKVVGSGFKVMKEKKNVFFSLVESKPGKD